MIRPVFTGVTGMRVTHQNLKKVQSIFFIPVRPAIKICRFPIDHEDFPTEKFDLEGPLFEYQNPPLTKSKSEEGVLGTDFFNSIRETKPRSKK